MTASVFSTGSPTARKADTGPRAEGRLDADRKRQGAAMKSYTYTRSASLHGRTWQGRCSRWLIADHAMHAGEHPEIFDTDAAERTLAACFPARAMVVDLDRVTDQISCSIR